MKILVITDCSERGIHYATTLYKNLSREIKDITFCIPMFMEYLIDTKIEPKYLSAFFYSLVSMKSVYKAAEEKNDDLIVIGNAPKELTFDAVFSFAGEDDKENSADAFIDYVKQLVVGLKPLEKYANNLYAESDCTFSLHNCSASSQFIEDYIKTEPKLDKIKEKYKDKVKFKEA